MQYLILKVLLILLAIFKICFTGIVSIAKSVKNNYRNPRKMLQIFFLCFTPGLLMYFIGVAKEHYYYYYRHDCEALRAAREYRRARYRWAGKGFLDTMDKYLKYNQFYGYVVIGMYVFFIAALGHTIGLLALVLTGIIIVIP